MDERVNQYKIVEDCAYGIALSGIEYIVDAEDVEWLQKNYICNTYSHNSAINAKRRSDNKILQLSRVIMRVADNDKRKVIRNNNKVLDYRKSNLWVGNRYELKGDYYEVTCRNQKTFKIDVEDYEIVSQYVWYVDVNGYVISDRYNGEKPIKQHRLIMGILNNPELEVDHLYHDTCDNRKKNLRIVGRCENVQNQRRESPNGHPGVELVRGYNDLWKASIGYNRQRIYLGCYHNKEDAIKARIDFERQHGIIRVI